MDFIWSQVYFRCFTGEGDSDDNNDELYLKKIGILNIDVAALRQISEESL